MSLRENIHRLTSDHLTTRITGKRVIMRALLDLLDVAITEQTTRGGDGSGGAAIPVGVGAMSLRQDIERDAREHQAEMGSIEPASLTAILHSWIELEGEWADFLEHVTLDWCDQIEAIVLPAKPPRRIHQPCPSCGILYGGDDMKPGLQVHCWGADEGMLPPGKWTAECIHCGASWTAGDMGWLARAVGVAS